MLEDFSYFFSISRPRNKAGHSEITPNRRRRQDFTNIFRRTANSQFSVGVDTADWQSSIREKTNVSTENNPNPIKYSVGRIVALGSSPSLPPPSPLMPIAAGGKANKIRNCKVSSITKTCPPSHLSPPFPSNKKTKLQEHCSSRYHERSASTLPPPSASLTEKCIIKL